MSFNGELVEIFERMGAVLELTGANRFKVLAYQRGARAIKDCPQDLEPLAEDIAAVTDIDGIGKGLAEKIGEYAKTGKVEEHDELIADVPPGVIAMLGISGLGPKTVATLWKQGGVESIEQLKVKIDSGELADLPRLGQKKLEQVAKSIRFAESSGQRTRIGTALPIARHLVQELEAVEGVKQIAYAGSLRRGQETIGDIDILASTSDPAGLSKAFGSLEDVKEVLAAGETKSSVRIEAGMQVDLRIVPDDRFGAALAYFTGSKEHNVALRERAVKRDLSLNEYGLWNAGEADRKDATPVAARTEQAIYHKLALAYIPPELRERRGEIAAAQADELPDLIEIDDIRCELHAHTTASDGKLSIDELAAVAQERGFHTIAVTDHSASQVQAHGLDARRLERHIQAVHDADMRNTRIRILAGAEVDIIADGKLDYSNSLLKELDIVVASPHAALSQDAKKATARLRRAIDNPYVHIIGHATGRLVGKREGLHPDMAEVFEAAVEAGVAMEINANPMRLDLRDIHAKAAVEAGVTLAINTDAHAANHFDLLHYGILTARRAWVEKRHVINCLERDELEAWLKRRR